MAKSSTSGTIPRANFSPNTFTFVWECELCGMEYTPASGRQKYCKICVPNKSWRERVQKYRLTPKLWDVLLAKQNGTCALCDKPPVFVDHDHECCPGLITCGKCIRGLLCAGCNTALHYFEKEVWIEKAKIYVQTN